MPLVFSKKEKRKEKDIVYYNVSCLYMHWPESYVHINQVDKKLSTLWWVEDEEINIFLQDFVKLPLSTCGMSLWVK